MMDPLYQAIVTGIPRSGTTLLCALLNSSRHFEIVVEPVEMEFALALPAWARTSAVKAYYKWLQGQCGNQGFVFQRTSIQGKRVTDTRGGHWIFPVRVGEKTHPVVVGTKHTDYYLLKSDVLRGYFDKKDGFYRAVCCVRDPVDTLYSWHMRGRESLWYRHLSLGIWRSSRLLSKREKDTYRPGEIARMAVVWNRYAQVIQENDEWLYVVKYEDVLRDACSVCEAIAIALGVDSLGGVLADMVVEAESEIDHDIREMIKEQIRTLAPARTIFGYS